MDGSHRSERERGSVGGRGLAGALPAGSGALAELTGHRAMAMNECGCGCDGPHGRGQEWAARLATIVDHVAPARPQPLPASGAAAADRSAAAPGFSICLDASALPAGATALYGRLLLIISRAGAVPEPRLQLSADRCEGAPGSRAALPDCTQSSPS